MKRLLLAAGLVFRPHPYAFPCSPSWRAWTTHIVWPLEAWTIAGAPADCPENTHG